MSKSSNSALSIIAGSLAVVGAFAAASLWNNHRYYASQDADKNDELAEFIGSLHLVRKVSLTDSEKLKQIVNASLEYCYHDLPAHIVGDSKLVEQKRTPADPEDSMQAVNQVINTIFNYCYVEKGDMSASSDHTDDTSVSFFSDSLEGIESTKIINSRSVSYDHTDDASLSVSSESDSLEGIGSAKIINSRSVSYDHTDDTSLSVSVSYASDSLEGIESSAKIINYEWDDEEYIEEKGLEQTPCSGSDAAVLMLASAFLVAQAFVCMKVIDTSSFFSVFVPGCSFLFVNAV